MAILGIEGKGGGGKSYLAVRDEVLPAIAPRSLGWLRRLFLIIMSWIRPARFLTNPWRPRYVVTNLPLKLDELERAYPGCTKWIVSVDLLPPDDQNKERASLVDQMHLHLRDDLGRGPLVVWDEIQDSLPNARGLNIKSAFDEKLFYAFTRQRHYNADLVILSQDLDNVDPRVVRLVHNTRRPVKASQISDKKFFVQFWTGSPVGKAKPEQVSKLQTYKAAFYQFYVSNTHASGTSEMKYMRAKPIWLRFPFLMVYACLAFVGYNELFGDSFFHNAKKTDTIQPGVTPSGAVNLDDPAVSGVPPTPAQVSPSSRSKPEAVQDKPPVMDVDHPFTGWAFSMASWEGMDINYHDYRGTQFRRSFILHGDGPDGQTMDIPIEDMSRWGYVVRAEQCAVSLGFPKSGFYQSFTRTGCFIEQKRETKMGGSPEDLKRGAKAGLGVAG